MVRNMYEELSSSISASQKVYSAKKLVFPAIVLACILFPGGRAAAWPVFSDPVAYPLSVKPHDIDHGDFNGDGSIDLAFGCIDSCYGVMLGNGDGSFTMPVLYGTDYDCVLDLAAGDLDNDGFDDLIIKDEGTWDLLILKSNGDGTFIETIVYPDEAFLFYTIWPVNDDEYLDIAGCCNDSLRVRLGLGDCTFSEPYTVPAGIDAYSVSFSDVTGDEESDAILPGCLLPPHPYAAFAILPGLGNGLFGEPGIYSVNTSLMKHYAACADFDGDGWRDVALSNDPGGLGDSTLEVLLNQGYGVFPEDPEQILLVGYAGEELLTEDYNYDGNADLIIVNNEFGRLYMGNGNGSFSFGEYLFTESMWHTSTSRITQADFDKDGAVDVAFSNEGTSYFGIVVLINSTDPQGIEERLPQTGEFTLSAAHSPFSESVTVTANGFSQPSQLNVYDITGRFIRSLTADPTGNSFIWYGTDSSGSEVPAGTYIIQGFSVDFMACVSVVKL